MNVLRFEFNMGLGGRPILAVGAQSKGSFAIFDGKTIYLNSSLGDLQVPENLKAFEEEIEELKKELKAEPEILVHDLHPDYLSTKYALDLASKHQAPSTKHQAIGIQHHYAHILSCMAENQITEEEVIGVAFDGTGYGTDGNVWGGEFLLVRPSSFKRIAHLKNISMPGAQAAIKEPWRMGFSYLYQAYGEGFENLDIEFLKKRKKDLTILKKMLDRKINSPLTSSIGRLFDAVSSILGIKDVVMYEGEAAVELEKVLFEGLKAKAEIGRFQSACLWRPLQQICRADFSLPYKFEIIEENGNFVIDPNSVIKAVVEDLKNGLSVSEISFQFHNAVCEMVREVCVKIKESCKINRVALSGGVFQNRFINGRVKPLLIESGFKVFSHNRVPCHDGGIALGQIIGARCVLAYQ